MGILILFRLQFNVLNYSNYCIRKTFSKGCEATYCVFYCFDIDHYVLELAKKNLKQSGVQFLINFQFSDAAKLVNLFTLNQQGFITSNAPYGKYLKSKSALIRLYSLLDRVLKSQFFGWRLSLFSDSPELLACLGFRAELEF